MYLKNAKSMFAPKCHICTVCHAFKMQPELHKMQPKQHNSADWGISKFSYLCLRLVVCFYPRPPTWHWSWGHMYRHLACVEWYFFFNNNFEFSSDHSNSILADPSIKVLRISFDWGCTIYLEVGNWSSRLARATKIVEIIVQSLLEDPLIARHWKRSFVSLLIIIN